MKRSSIKRLVALAVAVTATLAFSGLSWAAPRDGCDCAAATLTDAQKATAQKLHEEFRTAADPLRRQLDAKHDELRSLLRQDSPDAKQVEALSRDIGEIKGKLLVERKQHEDRLTKEGIPAFGRDRGRHGSGLAHNSHGRGHGPGSRW